MKSLLILHLSVLDNLGRQCSIDTARDALSITERCEDEGDSYLTITLPKFSKALEKGLEDGFWPKRGEVSNWKMHRGLPVFLRGFLLRVFDQDGQLLSNPDPDAIRSIRQIFLLSNKVEIECSQDRIKAAFSQFVETDRELIGLPGRIDPTRMKKFMHVSDRLFGNMFDYLETKVANFELVPKHGPGAVSEKISQKEKRDYAYWTQELDSSFPMWRYTSNLPVYRPQNVPVTRTDELPVRVVSVPKTQSTPRIIAIEPSAMQYAQQGLKREIYEYIGRGPLDKILGFRDQTRNRILAERASVSKKLGTLDLSEASDRVHWYLIERMLHRWPHLWSFVWSTRSYRAEVPFEGVIPLQKFASMGSALTFPLEAMVFTILAVCGMREQGVVRKISPSTLVDRLSVYGDDIIVPVRSIDPVIDWLEHFGAKVNRHKSFWKGSFRESCGAEFYNGHDVSIVRLRSELPSSQDDAAAVAALIDFRNRAYLAGLWGVVRDIDKGLDSLKDVPHVNLSQSDSASSVLHFSTVLPSKLGRIRFNADYQSYETKTLALVPRSRSYRVDGEAGLLEWFHDSLRRGDFVDLYDSKERASSFSLQRRWTPVRYLTGGQG
jgi:hypothetical protein